MLLFKNPILMAPIGLYGQFNIYGLDRSRNNLE